MEVDCSIPGNRPPRKPDSGVALVDCLQNCAEGQTLGRTICWLRRGLELAVLIICKFPLL